MRQIWEETLTEEESTRISSFDESHPETVLGQHEVKLGKKKIVSIRAFLPRAKNAWVESEGEKIKMELSNPNGMWEVCVDKVSKYKILYEDETGYVEKKEDPYSFRNLISDYDLYLFAEGTHTRIFDRLGAHLTAVEGVSGTLFSVWAPNARAVSLVCNNNHWQVGENPMMLRGNSGVWELFVPGLREWEVYKFAIKSKTGLISLKTDPYAFSAEMRPKTAAIVANLDAYSWHDQEWIESKKKFDPASSPISIYEVHLGSWKKKKDGSSMGYRLLADELIPYVKRLGFSHVELLPVMEHPLDDSWGYQVVNYYAPTSRYGVPQDFMYFVDKCHEAGIGVILDWVPAHFPKDSYGLAKFDSTSLYEHSDPRIGEHPDWGTLIFNYSRNEVKSFLVSNANFWIARYHVDGLRLDAVASMLYLDYSRKPGEWLPNKYGGNENLDATSILKQINTTVHAQSSNPLTIAEESTAWNGVTRTVQDGGLGFDLKWNMGWMHDTLDYFSNDPVFRKTVHGKLTFGLMYAFSEKFILVFSHDEVVHGKKSLFGKMPGDEWQKFANLRLCFGFMFTQPGKKLLFMGNEFGQSHEWDFKSGLDWNEAEKQLNAQLTDYVKKLNELFKKENALHALDFSQEGFEWVDFKDSEQSVISYLRKSKENFVLVVCNLTPVPRYNYRIGVPVAGLYKEILNSDAKEFGGSGVGNLGAAQTESVASHARPCSLNLTLPPLAILVFALDSPHKN